MPRVITPGTCGPVPVGSMSEVSPASHVAPWPRVSMTKCAYPADAQSSRSSGVPRPPP